MFMEAFLTALVVIAVPFGIGAIGISIIEWWVYRTPRSERTSIRAEMWRIDSTLTPMWRRVGAAPTKQRSGLGERIAHHLTVEDMEFTTPEFELLLAQLEERLWLNELHAQDWGDDPIMIVWLDDEEDPDDECADHYAHIVKADDTHYNAQYDLPVFVPMRHRDKAYNEEFLAYRKEANAQARRN